MSNKEIKAQIHDLKIIKESYKKLGLNVDEISADIKKLEKMLKWINHPINLRSMKFFIVISATMF